MRVYEEPIWASVRWWCMQSAGPAMLCSPSLLSILLFFSCGAGTKGEERVRVQYSYRPFSCERLLALIRQTHLYMLALQTSCCTCQTKSNCRVHAEKTWL